MDDARQLAAAQRVALVAPAGCGKTQLIAEAVGKHTTGRQLVLTHTHAGVDALRRRLRRLDVPGERFELDTLAGFALRIATAFPKTSGIAGTEVTPAWRDVYVAAAALLRLSPIKRIIQASFSGVFVDEYQDCTSAQHDLVLALDAMLPCRVLGDPLQGIFGFEPDAIDWPIHVAAHFSVVEGSRTPWRWADGKNAQLGEWLMKVRGALLHEQPQPIDLRNAPVKWYDGSDAKTKQIRQLEACRRAARGQDSVVGIAAWSRQCNATAQKLGGLFSSIEAIESDDLIKHAKCIGESVGFARAVATLEFAETCMTTVSTELKTIKTGLEKKRVPGVKKHLAQRDALVTVAETSSLANVIAALNAIREIPDVVVYRRELLSEMLRALRAASDGDATSLPEALGMVRNRTRRAGRRLPRCAVGTTRLVKGLEFDHAVILDGDALDCRNLYVAMTRGAKSLSIVSTSQVLRPAQARGTHRSGQA